MYTLYTVFITIFPILYYKLYLNTVYKYSITIYLYILPVFLYPKDGKKIHVLQIYHMGSFTI